MEDKNINNDLDFDIQEVEQVIAPNIDGGGDDGDPPDEERPTCAVSMCIPCGY